MRRLALVPTLLAGLAAGSAAGAQDFGGADGSGRIRPPSVLTLPETVRGTVEVPLAAPGSAPPAKPPARTRDGRTLNNRPLDAPPGDAVAGIPEAPRGAAIGTLRAIFPALAACWRPPDGLRGLEQAEVTLRLSLRRDGTVVGEPRVTYATAPAQSRAYQLLAEAGLDSIRHCTPVPLTPGLGAAVAGRPLAIRFVYRGPRGKDV